MKKSNNLSNVEKIKKYAKSMGIQVGNSGLNFDLGLDFKKKYTDQGMIFNKNDDSDKSATEKKSSEIKEESKNKEKSTAELQSKVNDINCKKHESIHYELLSNQECLKNAIILKEILDNQRIQRRRKRYSRFRSGRI